MLRTIYNKIKLHLSSINLSIFLSLFLFSSCISTSLSQRDPRNFNDLINFFENSNLTPEKIQNTRYRTLLASGGCALWIQGAKVEFYIYDTDIPKQKRKLEKIIKNKHIKVLSLNIPVVVNGGIVMLTYSDHPNKAKIVRTFKRFPSNYKK